MHRLAELSTLSCDDPAEFVRRRRAMIAGLLEARTDNPRLPALQERIDLEIAGSGTPVRALGILAEELAGRLEAMAALSRELVAELERRRTISR